MDQSHDSLNNQETFSSEYINTYKLHNHCEQTTPNEKPLEPPKKKKSEPPREEIIKIINQTYRKPPNPSN